MQKQCTEILFDLHFWNVPNDSIYPEQVSSSSRGDQGNNFWSLSCQQVRHCDPQKNPDICSPLWSLMRHRLFVSLEHFHLFSLERFRLFSLERFYLFSSRLCPRCFLAIGYGDASQGPRCCGPTCSSLSSDAPVPPLYHSTEIHTVYSREDRMGCKASVQVQLILCKAKPQKYHRQSHRQTRSSSICSVSYGSFGIIADGRSPFNLCPMLREPCLSFPEKKRWKK